MVRESCLVQVHKYIDFFNEIKYNRPFFGLNESEIYAVWH
jgi:hypothetical protein